MRERNFKKIQRYFSLLPEDYAKPSHNVRLLYDKLNEIYQLIKANRLDEAWQLYEWMPQIGYFTERVFPHLKIVHQQLSIIFIITRHKIDLQPGLSLDE